MLICTDSDRSSSIWIPSSLTFGDGVICVPEMEIGLLSMRWFLLLVANQMNSVFVGLIFRRCDDIHADM